MKASPLGATVIAGVAVAGLALPGFALQPARADEGAARKLMPSGQYITPTAAPGSKQIGLNPGLKTYPNYRAGWAIKTALNPAGTILLVMTSGYNQLNYPSGSNIGNTDPAGSNEYVFAYDVSGTNARSPVLKQVVQVPNTFAGLLWTADGKGFWVSGGVDDKVYLYTGSPGSFALSHTVALGHTPPVAPAPYQSFLLGGIGGQTQPSAGNLALTADGKTLVVGNVFNDSISLIDTGTNTLRTEYDLRPWNTSGQNGVAGGETPYDIKIVGSSKVYVSSIRDREVVVVDIGGAKPSLVKRIAVPGAPNAMVLNGAQTRLYVAQDNSDQVAVIDTASNAVLQEISTIAPPYWVNSKERFTGAAPNALSLSPDEKTLYVSNGGANNIAIVSLETSEVKGLIPTPWYPESVSVSDDGKTLYISNGKSNPGPNPKNLTGDTALLTQTTYPGGNAAALAAANGANQYILQLQRASLLVVPVPEDEGTLKNLTNQVVDNNQYWVWPSEPGKGVMAQLRQHIKHVIYIVKENRTFDQVLGDLGNGSNGEASLAVFGKKITPNFHRVSDQLVTLDNFYCSGEVSGSGWAWSTQSRDTDFNTKSIALNYAGRGFVYESEGQNRGIDVGYPTAAERIAVLPLYAAVTSYLKGGTDNVLPGTNNDGAADGPNGAFQAGRLWQSALAAGLTVRNYGFFIDLVPYNLGKLAPPLTRNPATHNPPVKMAIPVDPSLIASNRTDLFFRGFDNAYPDVWREEEWAREFAQFEANGDLPNLSLVRLMHDHMGSFSKAVGGFDTPETQQADNDLAVGRLIEAVAHSPKYASNTLVFVLEDDAQDGPDHVDAHRSTAYVAGPYVKHNAVVSTRYSTVNMLRTIEDILGIDHLNLNDAHQGPMADVFDLGQASWTYNAVASSILSGTQVRNDDGVRYADNEQLRPAHDAAYWEAATKGFDWSGEDRIPADLFNRVLWEGLMTGPYPETRDGANLRHASLELPSSATAAKR